MTTYVSKNYKEVLQNAQKFRLVDKLLNSDEDQVLTARANESFLFMKIDGHLAMVQTDSPKDAAHLEALAENFSKHGTTKTKKEIETIFNKL